MHPILCSFGPVTVHTYGAMLVVAFLLGSWLATRAARTLPAGDAPLQGGAVFDAACVGLLGGMVGGRVAFIALHAEFFAAYPLEVFALWHGGLVWYGGFVGGLLALAIYTRRRRIGLLAVMDQVIPFIALGHAIGRLGCFLNGCCYGKPADAWCAVALPGLPHRVWPAQLFEAVGLCALFLLLRAGQRAAVRAGRGRLLGWYLIGYGLLRFVVEGFRGDQTIWWAGLTLQQGVSIILLAAGAWLVKRGIATDR